MKIEKKPSSINSNEFSSIFDESPWERFLDKMKPLLKVVVAFALVGGMIYGGVLLFNGNKGTTPTVSTANPAVDAHAKDNVELAKCVSDSISANPTPGTGDPQFYTKLISNHDKQISCYDKYPNADQTDKSRLERLRQGAISARDGGNPSSSGVSGGSSSGEGTNTEDSGTLSTPQSSFSPHACDSYLNEYNRLKGIADLMHADLQKQLDGPVAPSQSVMDAWKEALDKQNNAYSDYQKCKAESYE